MLNLSSIFLIAGIIALPTATATPITGKFPGTCQGDGSPCIKASDCVDGSLCVQPSGGSNSNPGTSTSGKVPGTCSGDGLQCQKDSDCVDGSSCIQPPASNPAPELGTCVNGSPCQKDSDCPGTSTCQSTEQKDEETKTNVRIEN